MIFMAENAEKKSPRTPSENTSEIPWVHWGCKVHTSLSLDPSHHEKPHGGILAVWVIRPICKGIHHAPPKKNLVRNTAPANFLGIWIFLVIRKRHSLKMRRRVHLPTKWGPTSYKWGYNLYKWHEKCVIGDLNLPRGNTTSTYNQ